MKCPVHREKPARRCKTNGCPVWLSSYNPDEHCCLHGGWRRVKDGNNRKAPQERGEMLAELLAA